MSSRRDFVQRATLASAAMVLGPRAATAAATSPRPTAVPTRAQKLLILGGTGFIGPHTVKYALERGHEVTILTRGRSATKVDGVEHLIADREGDLSVLSRRKWDAVLDNNARDYRWVQRSTRALKDSTDHYLFISSISAYRTADMSYASAGDVRMTPVMEDYQRFTPPANWKDGDVAPYGLTKALSEDIVNTAFPGRNTIVRPGLIVGPGDPTDRWTYWVMRVDAGGEVMAPGNPNHSSQVIDQRDLMEWSVRLAEGRVTGAFNGTGPATRMTFAEMLAGCRASTTSAVSFTWVPESFLAEQKLRIWSDIPAWAPGDPLMYVSVARAVAAGLTYRPLATTAMDLIAWDKARPAAEREKRAAGITRAREAEVLAAWKQRSR